MSDSEPTIEEFDRRRRGLPAPRRVSRDEATAADFDEALRTGAVVITNDPPDDEDRSDD